LVNYYDILEIERSATEAEIKRAYRKQVLKWHPDRNPNNQEAADKFLLIQEAFETLSHYLRRSEYHDKLDGKYQEPEKQPFVPYEHTYYPQTVFTEKPVTEFKKAKKAYPKGTVPFTILMFLILCFVAYLYFFSQPTEIYIKSKQPIMYASEDKRIEQKPDSASLAIDSIFRASMLKHSTEIDMEEKESSSTE